MPENFIRPPFETCCLLILTGELIKQLVSTSTMYCVNESNGAEAERSIVFVFTIE
jgi:hypothetical protein